MPRTPNETKQKQFRLLPDTIADLDLIAAHLAETMGGKQTRTDAVRYAAREAAKKILGKKSKTG